MASYHLRIEAVNLDFTIYDTYDISTIRGGSFMQHDAFYEITHKKAKIKDLGSTASVALLRMEVPNEKEAKQVCDDILAQVESKIPFATIVHSMQKISPDKLFQEQLQELMAECRWQQYQSPSFKLPEEKNRDNFCEFDGVRPFVDPIKKGNEDIRRSQAVKVRQDNGRILRKNLILRLSNTPNLLNPSLINIDYPFTNDLESLTKDAAAGRLDGKMAFIYIDGNRFGKLRDKVCNTEKDYQEFQSKIQQDLRVPAIENVVRFAQKPENKSFLLQTSTKNQIRAEILLWGGDELELIVPAWQGFNVLQSIFNSMSNKIFFNDLHVTHTAGVIFCPHNLPILQVREYVHRLCELAKFDIPQDVEQIDEHSNKIAILNMTSIDMISGDILEFLNNYYKPIPPETMVIEAGNFGGLMSNLQVIDKYLPRNKLYAILHTIKNGQPEKIDDILNSIYKRMNAKTKEILKNAIDQLIIDNYNRWLLAYNLLDYSGGIL